MTDHTPVAASERLESVDLVRGYALLGVLLMNVHYWFRNPPQPYWLNPHPWPGALNHFTDNALKFWFETKSVTLFSMLFAVGLCIQRERALAKGLDWGGYAARRLASMFLFGVLHVVLLWNGDILHWYALCALVLLPFLGRSEKVLRWWALGAAGLMAAGAVAASLPQMIGPPPPAGALAGIPGLDVADARAWGQACLSGYQQHAWTAVLRFRLQDYVHTYLGPVAGTITGFILLNFLIGAWIWKTGVLRDLRSRRRDLGRTALALLATGCLMGTVLTFPEAILAFLRAHWTWGRAFLPLISLSMLLGVQPMALGIASGLLWLQLHPGWRRALRPLEAAGRMAFTNYILQSVVCSFVFYGWGLGCYNRMGPAAGAAFCLALFALQVLLSGWWLARFRFGPLEWLWRCLTYGELQPFRLGAVTEPA